MLMVSWLVCAKLVTNPAHVAKLESVHALVFYCFFCRHVDNKYINLATFLRVTALTKPTDFWDMPYQSISVVSTTPAFVYILNNYTWCIDQRYTLLAAEQNPSRKSCKLRANQDKNLADWLFLGFPTQSSWSSWGLMPLVFHQWPIQMMWQCERKPGRWKQFCEVASFSHRSAGIASLQWGASGTLLWNLQGEFSEAMQPEDSAGSFEEISSWFYGKTCEKNKQGWPERSWNRSHPESIKVCQTMQRCIPERQRLIRWFNFWLDIANDSVFLQVCALDMLATDLNALIILIRFAHAVHCWWKSCGKCGRLRNMGGHEHWAASVQIW